MPHMYNHTDAYRGEMKKTSKGMKRKTPTKGVKNKPKNPIKKKGTHMMPNGVEMSGKTHNKDSKAIAKKKKPMLKKKKTISY